MQFDNHPNSARLWRRLHLITKHMWSMIGHSTTRPNYTWVVVHLSFLLMTFPISDNLQPFWGIGFRTKSNRHSKVHVDVCVVLVTTRISFDPPSVSLENKGLTFLFPPVTVEAFF